MKFLLGLLIVSSIVSCKDVEKNPSGCEYGTVNEDGMCVRASYKAEKVIEEVNQSLFIKEYFDVVVDEYYGDRKIYELKIQKFTNELNNGDQVANLQSMIKKVSKNLEFLRAKFAKMEEVYEVAYSEALWNYKNRVETLITDLESIQNSLEYSENKRILVRDYHWMDEEQKKEYAKKYDAKAQDLKTIADRKEYLLGEYKVKVVNSRASGYNLKLEIIYEYQGYNSEIGKDLRNGVERYFLADESCQDDQLQVCISDYYQTVEDEALTLYNNYLK